MGFSFGAKDDGLGKMQKSTLKGFAELNKSLKTLGSGSMEALNKDLARVQENIRNITGTIDSIDEGGGGGDEDVADDDDKKARSAHRYASMLGNVADSLKDVAKEGLNLTTGMEAQYKAIDVHASQYGAQINSSNKSIAKSNEYAREGIIDLGLSTDKLVEDYQNYTLAQDTFAKMGMKTAGDFSKVTTVYGLNSEKLQKTVTDLSGPLGLSTDQIDKLFGGLQQAGDKAHSTAEAMQSFGKVVQTVKEQRALGATADQAFKFAQESEQLTGMLGGMTNNFESASKASDFLTKGLIETKQGMVDLRSGTAEDINKFANALNIAALPMQEIMDLQKSGGPAAVFKRIFEEIAKAKATGNVDKVSDAINFMNSQFRAAGASNEDLQLLTAGLTSATPDMLKFSEASFDASKATTAFVNKLTDADRYTAVLGRFDAKFRKFGESSKEWADKSARAFNDYTKDLDIVYAKGDSVDRKILARMAEIDKFGMAAILPEKWMPIIHQTDVLAKNFDKFGSIFKDIPWVGGFIKPLEYVLGLVLTMHTKLTAEFDQLSESVAEFLEGFGMNKNTALEWARTIMSAINSISKAATEFMTHPLDAIHEAWDNVKKGLDWSDWLADQFGNSFRTVMDKFSDWGPSYLMTRVLPSFSDVFAAVGNAFLPKMLQDHSLPKIGSASTAMKLREQDLRIAAEAPGEQVKDLAESLATQEQFRKDRQAGIDIPSETLDLLHEKIKALTDAIEKNSQKVDSNTDATHQNSKTTDDNTKVKKNAPPATTFGKTTPSVSHNRVSVQLNGQIPDE